MALKDAYLPLKKIVMVLGLGLPVLIHTHTHTTIVSKGSTKNGNSHTSEAPLTWQCTIQIGCCEKWSFFDSKSVPGICHCFIVVSGTLVLHLLHTPCFSVSIYPQILNQDSQDTVITAAATTTTTIITAKTSVTSASHSTKQKTNQRQNSHLNMSHSSLHALPFPPFSSHSSPLSSSSSSSSLPHLSRVSNTPREIASIIHATYMSTALHNSRFTTPTLTDLWKHKSSSVSLQSSFESNV